MTISKLTSKSQNAIPQPVRLALGLEPGDVILFEIEDNRVVLTRADQGPVKDDPFHGFDEWFSEADEQAYAGL